MRGQRVAMNALSLSSLAIMCHVLAGSAVAGSTSRLSITGIAIDDGHHLTIVAIQRWGVDALLMCHIPPVSAVSVDFDISPDGVVTWQGNS
jgi:hypothetical protein